MQEETGKGIQQSEIRKSRGWDKQNHWVCQGQGRLSLAAGQLARVCSLVKSGRMNR